MPRRLRLRRQPYVIPTLHPRVGDIVYLHGSTASRMVRTLAAGAPCARTVTLLDGVVLARSAFHQSANYRSVTVLGIASLVTSGDERMAALEAFTEQLVPGRWEHVRPPSAKEMKGTQVLALSLDEASAKVRTGPPVDDDEDMGRDVWAGELPLALARSDPRADPQLAEGDRGARARRELDRVAPALGGAADPDRRLEARTRPVDPALADLRRTAVGIGARVLRLALDEVAPGGAQREDRVVEARVGDSDGSGTWAAHAANLPASRTSVRTCGGRATSRARARPGCECGALAC